MSPQPLRIALIDNYDSYSYNLAHLLAIANQGIAPLTILSDSFSCLSTFLHRHGSFHAFVLSPGPGNPTKLSDFSPLQRDILSSSFPVLAVCLGHQALCHLHGFSIRRLPSGPAHGVVSKIFLSPAASSCPLFMSLPQSFSVVRYHSLAASPDNLDSSLITTAWALDSHPQHPTLNSVIMAVRHKFLPHFGLQFHPESISSYYGDLIASNFISFASRLRIAYSCPPCLPLCSSQPLTTPTSISSSFTTLLRNLGPQEAQPFFTFSSLFYGRCGSFWLDSGVVDSNLAALLHPTQKKSYSLLEKTSKTQRHQNARFSIMGCCEGPNSELVTYNVDENVIHIRKPHLDMDAVTVKDGCIFDYVKLQLEKRYSKCPTSLPCDMNGGFVGFFGYELKRDMQGVRSRNEHKSSVPDAWLVFADRLLLIDHETNEIFLIALVPVGSEVGVGMAHEWFTRIEQTVLKLSSSQKSGSVLGKGWKGKGNQRFKDNGDTQPLKFIPERCRKEYFTDISKCLQAIEAGESYEICLTNRLRAQIAEEMVFDTLEFYGVLRTLNPAPYSAFLQLSETEAVCCTSPERYLTISSTGRVESKPIKGTRRRGQCIEEDEKLRKELENSSKDRSENLMIVDLVRNDLSRTCKIGSVQVPKLMQVESYATVHQLVSTVTGALRHDMKTVDCIRAAYPMGSMTGAPKIRTMEIIDSIETCARGVYSGTIGYISVNGAADLNVVIRTAVIRDREIEIGAGGAIVSKSCPQDEYDETILKGRALMQSAAKYFTGDRNGFVIQHKNF